MDINSLWTPALSIAAAAVGGWTGVKIAVTKLEVHMEDVREKVTRHTTEIQRHNEDLLIHDLELESVLEKLAIPRARRQRLRD